MQIAGGHLGNLPGVGDVDLVQGDEPRPVLKSSVRFQLGLDDIEIGDRIAARQIGGAVDHMDDGGASFNVAQEVEPETASFAGALDQPGHVRDREADVTGDHDTEVGHQGREGVVGDLGPGAGDRRHQ